jgi:ferritin-like metal-binding protein YciE
MCGKHGHMAQKTETPARDAKLVQYLNEAYGKERELEEALRAHIEMTDRDTYKKRLREHLRETTAQAKGLERRIKQLGGRTDIADATSTVTSAASKAVSMAKAPLHMLRGTGQADKLVKNAKTELASEFEEIANYLAIEELATTVGDKETAKLAREYRRQEERMANFLQKLIPQLTKQVAREEIPAAERRVNGSGRRRSTTASRSRTRGAANGSSSSRSTRAKSTTARSTSRKTTARAKSGGTTRAKSTASGSKASGSASRTRARGTSRKSK